MTNNGQDDRPILVLGGTGKTGSRVAARLEARGVPVRVGSRSADPSFYWEDRSTWAPALDGVRSPDESIERIAETKPPTPSAPLPSRLRGAA